MRKLHTLLLLLFLSAIGQFAFGQKTRVTGLVSDAETGEPLPFVNVSFQGTKIGTTTNLEGNYVLESYYSSDSVEFSFVGYQKSAARIKRDEAQTINIKLKTSNVELGEVVVKFDKKKENPAHPIIRNVIANKKINDREKLSAYQYEAYNKVEFDINNLDEELKDRKLMKPFQFIFDYVDSTGEKPYLPIFITEAITDFYYRKNPKSQFEYIKATKVSGIENQSISTFLGDMYQNMNVYDNNIIAFNRSFISPISSSGFTFYKYYLTDSTVIDNQFCYKIEFLAKRKQEPTFEGSIWIHDTTYAVKKVEASISETANLNFINKFWVKQEFDQVEPEVWMLTKDELVIDFNIAKKSAGFYGRKTSTYKDFVINKPKPDDFYSNVDNIQLADDVNEKNQQYWDDARHESLTEQEQKIYHMIDSVKTVPQFTTIIDIINIAVNGYYIAGPVELGPYSKVYSFNPVEGNRFRVGLRTSNAFSTKLLLEGYAAYGLRDQMWKYGGGITYFLSKKSPRVHVYAGYMNDVEQLGLSANNFSQDNFLSSLFRRNPAQKLTFTERYKSYLDYEWFPGFSTRVTLQHENYKPLGVLKYERRTGENSSVQVPNITNATVSFFTRFAYNEKFVYGEFERISLGTKYPVIEMEYSKSFPGLYNSEFSFHKIEAAVKHHFKLGIFGRTSWRLEAGAVEGPAPYPLLEIHNGNETFWYDDYSFNTMNFFEFVSDRYASLSATHHFEGFFLNRIPLLRKLKWREVISAKALVGSYNQKNSDLLLLTDNIYTLNRGPFYEAAIGIENIFKFIRVDALWRLSYLDNPNIIKFGIRMKFQFQF